MLAVSMFRRKGGVSLASCRHSSIVFTILQCLQVMLICRMNKDESKDRFEAVEIKLSYIEDFMNQIQHTVLEQSTEIAALKRENKMLSDKLRDMADSLESDIPNRRPPHY